LPDFKTGEVAPCRFSKALGATLRHLLSNRSKRFKLACFEPDTVTIGVQTEDIAYIPMVPVLL
jgi:hypothetical protein